MTLKRRDNAENQAHWDFIEKVAQQSREHRPSWAREIERRENESETTTTAATQQQSLICK